MVREYAAFARYVRARDREFAFTIATGPQTHRRQVVRMSEFLQAAQYYELSPEVVSILLRTKSRAHPVRLPYPEVWLEAPFEWKDLVFHGMLLFEKQLVPPELGEPVFGQFFSTVTFHEGYWWNLNGPYIWQKWHEDWQSNAPAIVQSFLGPAKTIVSNFCDIISSPTIRVSQHDRKPKNIERKRREHGIAPPVTVREIVLSPDLERYFAKIAAQQGEPAFSYKHAFRVGGHWRTLHHERFKRDEAGNPRAIWIPDYTRGRGRLVPSVHIIKTEDENENR